MAGHSRSKNGVASLAYGHASRIYPTCASMIAELGQARVPMPSTSLPWLMPQDVDARDAGGMTSVGPGFTTSRPSGCLPHPRPL
jgi:hypothetical protein